MCYCLRSFTSLLILLCFYLAYVGLEIENTHWYQSVKLSGKSLSISASFYNDTIEYISLLPTTESWQKGSCPSFSKVSVLKKYIYSSISKITCYTISYEKVNSFYWWESELNAAKIIYLSVILCFSFNLLSLTCASFYFIQQISLTCKETIFLCSVELFTMYISLSLLSFLYAWFLTLFILLRFSSLVRSPAVLNLSFTPSQLVFI